MTRWTYDAVGNTLTETLPDNTATTRTYDARNRLLTTTNAKGETTTFAYDPGDNLASLTDARSNTYSFLYDLLDRRTRMTYPGGSFEAWAYNDTAAPGTVWTTYTARDGTTMACSYDNRSRETLCDFSDPGTPDVSKTYDPAGRLLSASSSVSSSTFAYDAANQLLSETVGYSGLAGNYTTAYAYDMDGNRQSVTYPGGTVVERTFTARNQVRTVSADGPPPLATYTYDLSGLPLSLVRENLTATTFAYDAGGRLTGITHSANATAFRTIGYTLDANSRRTSRSENAAADTYGYDPIGQLTAATYAAGPSAAYAYDGTGNRQSVSGAVPGAGSYTANALNQYSVAPGSPFHDTNGNIVSANGRTMTYDSQNRLTGVQSLSANLTVAADWRNRAVKRTLNGVTTYLIYDDWSLIEERTASGTLVQKYIHGPGVDNLLAKTDTSGTVYYHQDGLGSTVALTSSTGAVVENYRYDAFGTVTIFNSSFIPQPSSLFSNRFLFTGREYLAEVTLYDYRNRAYDPELGRFLQTDPIRFHAGDVNLYRYVANSVANFSDPTGQNPYAAAAIGTYLAGSLAAYGINSYYAAEQVGAYQDAMRRLKERYGDNIPCELMLTMDKWKSDLIKELGPNLGGMLQNAPNTTNGGPAPSGVADTAISAAQSAAAGL